MGAICSPNSPEPALLAANAANVSRHCSRPGERSQRHSMSSEADPDKWMFEEIIFSSSHYSLADGQKTEVEGPIEEGIATLKANPETYSAMYYQTSKLGWEEDQQDYQLVLREGKEFRPANVADDGWATCLLAKYQALPHADDVDLASAFDEATDSFEYNGSALPALCPGRGAGVADVVGLKIFGEIDPSDVSQGSVGDCWMLSAISALAEFDGAVKKLFKNTEGVEEMPRDGPNSYTVTLYELSTFEPVDVVVDERLAMKADGSGACAAKISLFPFLVPQ